MVVTGVPWSSGPGVCGCVGVFEGVVVVVGVLWS